MTNWKSIGLLILGLILGGGILAVVQKMSTGEATATPETPRQEGEATPGTPGRVVISPAVEQPTTNPIQIPRELSPKARIAASRFRCVCGCPDDLLSCECQKDPGGITMKNYLQDLVDQGMTNEEIDRAMVEKYGEEVMLFFHPDAPPDSRTVRP